MSSKPRSTGAGIVAAALKAGTKVAASVAAASTGADPVTAEIAGEIAAEQSVAMFGLFQEKLAAGSSTGRLIVADSSISYAFDEARAREAARALGDVIPQLEEKARRLEEADVGFTGADAAAVLPWWWEAFQATHGAKKRELLMAALSNSFDPEVYEQGLVRALFRLLAELDYGELWMLREKLPPNGVEWFHDPGRGPGWRDEGGTQRLDVEEEGPSMDSHHLRRLFQAGVVHIRAALPLSRSEQQSNANAMFPGPRDIRRVRRLQVSGLGERLRRLLVTPGDHSK